MHCACVQDDSLRTETGAVGPDWVFIECGRVEKF